MVLLKQPAEELIPNQIDRIARHEPDRIVYECPVSAHSYDEGFLKITTADFSNAVNGVAFWLEQRLGGKGKNFECLAYIGPNDVRYSILIAGAVKSGYKSLLLSPRNSLVAQKDILAKCKCSTFITTDPTPPAAEAVISALPELNLLKLPSLDEILSTKHPHYPYEKTYAESAHDPLVVVHTSGSTGIPKPMVYSHSFACRLVNIYQVEAPDGFWPLNTLWLRRRVHSLLPLFHAGGFINYMACLFLGDTFILPASGSIPTAHGLVEVARRTPFTIAQVTPATILEMAQEPGVTEELRSKGLEYLFFAGGDLPLEIGNQMARLFKLFTIMGSTEIGVWPQIKPLGEWDYTNWKYVAPCPRLGIEFRSTPDGLFEQLVIRKPELEQIQPVFTLFPDLQEFSTKDLYSKHPTEPHMYTFCGRADDVIVFLNGEKTNPTSFESAINSHPEVTGALVAGAQRWQACLLIELRGLPAMSVTERSVALEKIWPLIEDCNQQCPAHARVSKSHVMFVKPDKPMSRSAKGAIQRMATTNMYRDEMNALYADVEKMTEAVDIAEIVLDNTDTLAGRIREQVQGITHWDQLDVDDDFFARGMDSLQVLTLSRNLRAATSLSVAPSTIYSNASSARLAQASMGLLEQKRTSEADKLQQSAALVLKCYERMKCELDALLQSDTQKARGGVKAAGQANPPRENHDRHTVLLTGSTGSVGTYLLDELVKNSNVDHIYCFNRSKDSRCVQLDRSRKRFLSTTSFTPNRVTFLTVSMEQENFGLADDEMAKISSSVTCIIHNAWPVNFNLPLDAFQPALKGLVQLIGLAALSTQGASLLFVSSIGSVQTYAKSLKGDATVPENVLVDPLAGIGMAYGQSKHIAERLVDYGNTQYGVTGSFARVGQVAGPVYSKGYWAKQEWLPSLVISSRHIGALPATLSRLPSDTEEPKVVDWVPVDVLARVLVELALHGPSDRGGHAPGAKVFHVLNPKPVTWSSLLPTLSSRLQRLEPGRKTKIETVPLDVWISRLRQSREALDTNASDVDQLLELNPGLKLLDFYENMAATESTTKQSTGEGRLSLDGTLKASASLHDLGGVKPDWMGKWLDGWFHMASGCWLEILPRES